MITAAIVMIATALGSVGLSAPPSHAADPESDVNTIIGRLQDYYLSQGDEVQIANGIYLAQTSEALDYVASQNADGSWSDVNYQDTTSSANGKTWDAYKAPYQATLVTPDGTAVWTASRIFNAGDTAVYRGRDYLAKRYTRNQAPGDPNGPWKAAG